MSRNRHTVVYRLGLPVGCEATPEAIERLHVDVSMPMLDGLLTLEQLGLLSQPRVVCGQDSLAATFHVPPTVTDTLAPTMVAARINETLGVAARYFAVTLVEHTIDYGEMAA